MRAAVAVRSAGRAFPDRSGIAPAYNIPTVTVAAVGASAVPTIAGSAGWQREKRTGVAENVAGAAQTSTATLDRTGSTRFTYPGTGAPAGTTSNPGRYVSTGDKPGGGAQNAKWLMTIDTVLTGTTIEIPVNVVTTSGQLGLIVVDGLRTQTTSHVFPSTPAAGSGAGIKLTFPDSRTRHIQIYGLNSGEGRFGGAAVPAGESIAKPISQGRTIATIGDSYVNGATLVRQVETFAWQASFRLGAETVIQAGIGGTGFVHFLSGQPTSNFAGRRADVMAENPDIIILAGGRNDDTATAAEIQAAVEAEIDYYAPLVDAVYVVPTCSESLQTFVRTAMQAACASRHVPFINVLIDTYEKLADGIHPSFAGHQLMGNDAADRMLSFG